MRHSAGTAREAVDGVAGLIVVCLDAEAASEMGRNADGCLRRRRVAGELSGVANFFDLNLLLDHWGGGMSVTRARKHVRVAAVD